MERGIVPIKVEIEGIVFKDKEKQKQLNFWTYVAQLKADALKKATKEYLRGCLRLDDVNVLTIDGQEKKICSFLGYSRLDSKPMFFIFRKDFSSLVNSKNVILENDSFSCRLDIKENAYISLYGMESGSPLERLTDEEIKRLTDTKSKIHQTFGEPLFNVSVRKRKIYKLPNEI